MSRYFGDLTTMLCSGLNIPLIVNIRRVRMEREGWYTDHVNWEHYVKVLEAKKQLLSK